LINHSNMHSINRSNSPDLNKVIKIMEEDSLRKAANKGRAELLRNLSSDKTLKA
jgi:hypothetical protein